MPQTNRVKIAAMVVALGAGVATAHETDQWTVPPDGDPLVDIGGYLNQFFVQRLEDALEQTNLQIKKIIHHRNNYVRRAQSTDTIRKLRASSQKSPPAALEPLQSPEGISQQVRAEFPLGPTLIDSLESDIQQDKQLKRENPGRRHQYKPDNADCVFVDTDTRLHSNFARLWRSPTINAYGTHFGVDKIGHFVHMGYDIYLVYRRLIRAGHDRDEAMFRAMQFNVEGAGGEKGVFGSMTVGSYSNADLVSNYVGCLFFRNLTETVDLKGQSSAPMLMRNGPFWQIADHVYQNPKFFSRFISDHYDESLNPSLYAETMQSKMRQNVTQRHEDYLAYYCNQWGRPRSRAYFDILLRELSTYYGRDYGHQGTYFELISVGSTWAEQLPREP